MPLTARPPRDVFQTLQDHLHGVLNNVLTQYRLRFIVSGVKHDQASLVFFSPQGIPVAVPLRPSSWFLYLGQELKAVPEGKIYTIRTLKYEYRVQRSSSLHDEAEV